MPQQANRRIDDRGETRHVGSAVSRVDAASKVTGQAEYAIDFDPPDALHAALVTSQVPHARLDAVDTADAEAMAGVAAVVTAEDVPDTKRGAFIYDQPILPEEKVRYVGEPIAIVVAETDDLARQAARAVSVDYDELTPVFDLESAFERDPPGVVHEDVEAYEFATQGDPRYGGRDHADEAKRRPNLLYKHETSVGDVDRAFDAADHVVEREYEVEPIQHCAMEPHVAVAEIDGEGGWIRSSHQVPHNVEKHLASIYPDLDRSALRVEAPYVGGGFGGKITPLIETLVVAAARAVDSPVRLQFSRSQEFTSGVSRPQVITTVRDGVTDDGELVARDVDILFNCGAYNEQVFRCTVSATDQLYGVYDIPNLRWGSHAVYTNRPKYGAFRGFGKPEINWALERHMDYTAEQIGMDPVEYRARNLLREGDQNALGETLGPNRTEDCLRRPIEHVQSIDRSDLPSKYQSDEWRLGTGVAVSAKSVARAASSVTVKVRRGMQIHLHVGASDIGQGSDTAFTQIAAEEFGVDTADIRLVTGDTDRTPYTRGPTGSRFTYHTGNAIRKAAADVKRQIRDAALDHFEGVTDPSELRVEGERVTHIGSGRSIHVDELFSDYDHERGVSNTVLAAGGELIGTATFDARDGEGKHACWTPVGQAALVGVNRVTGKAEVVAFATACDVGRAINPGTVTQQLEGAAAQGIATALYEEIVYDGGRVINPNFKDYRIPAATELPPEQETIVFESRSDEGPYGAKGVGEAGMLAAAPAVGNAVVDALGTEFTVLPLTPERILPGAED